MNLNCIIKIQKNNKLKHKHQLKINMSAPKNNVQTSKKFQELYKCNIVN